MTKPIALRATILAAVGSIALLATGASAQQGQGQPFDPSRQGQIPSYQPQGQPMPPTQGQAQGPFQGQPQFGQPQFARPAPQLPEPVGRQAFGLGYLHGRVEAEQMARTRLRQVADELVALGYQAGLEAGMRNNPAVSGLAMPGYGRTTAQPGAYIVTPAPWTPDPVVLIDPRAAGQLIGRTVETADNQPVGVVRDIILAPGGNRVETLLVEDSGGLLVGVRPELVQSTFGDTVALVTTADELMNGPIL